MSSKNNKPQITFKEDENTHSEIIHEILNILHREKIPMHRAKFILQSALRATELIPFEWDTKRKIPATV